MLSMHRCLLFIVFPIPLLLMGWSNEDLRRGREEMQRGDYVQAEKDFQIALADAQKKKDQLGTIVAYSDLAQSAERQQHWEAAEQYLVSELQVRQSRGYAAALLPGLVELERFYARQRRWENDVTTLQQMIAIWVQVGGPDAIGIARYQKQLGQAYRALKDNASAEQAFRNALALFEQNNMVNSPAAAMVQVSLAQTLESEGKMEEAGTLWEAAMRTQRSAGEGNSYLSNAKYGYAHYLRSVGKTAEADALNLPQRDRNSLTVESHPVLLSKQEPEYSDAARRKKISGTIRLSLVVDEEGKAQNVQVVEPLGFGLDEQAVKAVSTWRFQPATKNGNPVKQAATVEVSFNLL